MKLIRLACAILMIVCVMPGIALFAQTPPKVAFEVASIKPAPPLMTLVAEIQSGKRGVASLQQNINDARADFGYMPLNNLIMYAFKMKTHQVIGPDWLGGQAFEIHATLPAGTSKDQVPEMMQTLLAERFKFVAHKETRDIPVYALLVSKDGPKLKAAEDIPVAAENSAEASSEKGNANKGEILSLKTAEGPVSIKQEKGGMVVNGGKTGQLRMNMGQNGVMSLDIARVTMADFSELLTQLLDKPVVDKTELKGSYQVALEIPMEELLRMAQQLAPRLGISLPPGIGGAGNIAGAAAPGAGGLGASDPAGGGIFQAVQKLGLKLDSQKSPVETLVIDSIEKTPTED